MPGHKSLCRDAVDESYVRELENASPEVTLYVRAAGEDVGGGARVVGDLMPEATNLISCIESQRTAPPATSSAWKPGRRCSMAANLLVEGRVGAFPEVPPCEPAREVGAPLARGS
jgi:hypothetical protein